MRVALWRNHKHGFESVNQERQEKYYSSMPEYVRVSEYIDIDFPMLKPEETVARELAALDAEERELRDALARQLVRLNDRRSQLRALTVQS